MLEKLLEAIIGLTNALNAHAAALAANPTKAAGKKAATDSTPVVTSTAQPTATAASQAATQQPAQSAAAASPAGAAAPTAQQAGEALVAVANGHKEKGRETAIAILAKYGAQKFDGVKPTDYAAFIQDCQQAVAGFSAPVAGAAGLF